MQTTSDRPVATRDPHGSAAQAVTADLAYLRVMIVNVLFYGEPGAGDRSWVLIDAGLKGSADAIARAAEERFGAGARPSAIVLTHGHFDHVGALRELAERYRAQAARLAEEVEGVRRSLREQEARVEALRARDRAV